MARPKSNPTAETQMSELRESLNAVLPEPGVIVGIQSTFKSALSNGVPLAKVQFHAAVNNADNVPENYFSASSEVKSRRPEMWLTSIGYVFKQDNAQGKTVYFGCPTANGIYHIFK